MRYLVLAADYDGTLATHGVIDPQTQRALERFKESGRKLILVTGRELDELLEICPMIDLFDRVVAENGALLYRPDTRSEKLLAERPPDEFVSALRKRGVAPLSVGRAIVATWIPHEQAVIETIRDFGLELHVIFNKRAVMVLPSGVNKATGLAAALQELQLSPRNAIAVGDAENDHAFMAECECAVAVANALPVVKERADLVAAGDHGAGVAELIEKVLNDDLAAIAGRLHAHAILLGKDEAGRDVCVEPQGKNVLIAGTSGSGKSTMTQGLLERFAGRGYQFVIIDPEGDYATIEGAIVLGNPHTAPSAAEMLDLLASPRQNVVVNLLGVALKDRPARFMSLLPHLQELRTRTGRPHWVVVDEAHHLLPAARDESSLTLPQEITGMILITVHPESVAVPALNAVDMVLATGNEPGQTIRAFCDCVGEQPPSTNESELESGDVMAWQRYDHEPPKLVHTIAPRSEHNRHLRKYAEGNLGPERSFCVRGPDQRLNLKAQNLVVFLQMAEGVDDATWLYHLRRGDYSAWFREGIKDKQLARDAASVEATKRDRDAAESRTAIREAVENRYTLPTRQPSGDMTPNRR